jgi:hypothetical protein
MRIVRVLSSLAVAGLLLGTPAQAVPAAVRAQGSTTWIRAFVNPASVSPAAFDGAVTPVADGGYLVAGSTGVSPYNAWIGKAGTSGALQWQKQARAPRSAASRR